MRVGEGGTVAAALDNLTTVNVQSAGTWPRDRDVLVIANACAESADDLGEALGDGMTVDEAEAAEASS